MSEIDFYVSSDGLVFRPMRGGKGGGGGGTTTTQTVQKNDPWEGQQPYLKTGFAEAEKIYNSNSPTYFQGQTVAGLNPTQQVAQGMTTQRALTGSPVLQAGQNEATKTLSGDYLKAGNPYISSLTDSINAAVRPGIDARFSGSGRYGSAGHEGATTSAITNALAPQLFGAYENERSRMGQMTTQAPTLAGADYTDINALANVGGQQQQQSQADINAAIEKHNFEQNVDANKLANYMNLIGGNYGGTMTGTQTQNAPSGGKGGSVVNDISSLGNAGANAYMAYSLSDVRLKTDIKRVGTTDGGLPVYTYRYKWGGPVQMGVMAQDVEKVMPDAVGEIGGFKAVDYGRVV